MSKDLKNLFLKFIKKLNQIFTQQNKETDFFLFSHSIYSLSSWFFHIFHTFFLIFPHFSYWILFFFVNLSLFFIFPHFSSWILFFLLICRSFSLFFIFPHFSSWILYFLTICRSSWFFHLFPTGYFFFRQLSL